MKITTVGIDLAKNVFQVHGIDGRGKAVLRKQRRRAQVAAFFANLPRWVIGMEACASTHHWARALQRFGHTERLIAPQFVKPYVKSNKNDVADAEAICEAVSRPNIRFVPIKHRAAGDFVSASTRTAAEEAHHRLLRRSRSDGKIGKTVVGQTQNGRITSSAIKRMGANQPNPSGTVAQATAKVRMYGCNVILSALMN